MFNKSKEKPLPPLEKVNRPMRPTSSSIPSIIGSDIRIIGNLTTPGEVQLDGVIEGDIVCGSLTIGEHGLVTGTVKVDTLYLRGRIEGKLRAKVVNFERTAQVKGDVTYETMTMESGVMVEGKLIPMKKKEATMQKPAASVSAQKPVAPSPAAKPGNGADKAKRLL